MPIADCGHDADMITFWRCVQRFHEGWQPCPHEHVDGSAAWLRGQVHQFMRRDEQMLMALHYEEGMALNAVEQRALMLHRVASHVDGVDRWLDWGDLPMLGEFTFERLADATQEFAADLYRQAAELVDDLPGLLARVTDSGRVQDNQQPKGIS